MIEFLERLADDRPLVYDGGFGSELFARGIELTNSALANQLHGDAVVDIHSSFIRAGADAIGTNTFVASELHLKMAGVDSGEVNRLVRQAVAYARAAIEREEKEAYIAGSVGPSPGAIEADAGGVDFGIPNDAVRAAHERVIWELADAGVDFLTVETMFSANEAVLIVDIARRTGLPIAVNLTGRYNRDRKTGGFTYRTDWGHGAAELLSVLGGENLLGIEDVLPYVQILGFNCGAESDREDHCGMPYAINGVRQFGEAMEEAGVSGKRLMAYPNAGLPKLDKNQKTYYSQTPEEMIAYVSDLLDAGAYFIGGCCGTGPDHIRGFRAAVDARKGN